MFFRRTSQCWLVLFTIALILPAGMGYPAVVGDNKVGGTGTIVPRGGLARMVGVPGLMIDKIYVHDGDIVKAGTPLFALQNPTGPFDLDTAELELQAARKDAEYRTALETLAVKAAEVRAQHAKRDAANYRAIGANGTNERELSRLQQAAELEQINLDAERVRADQLKFDLATAIHTATAKRDSAIAGIGRFTVRSPSDGTVIKIHRHVGELVDGPEPVLEFGDVSTMYVDAQVYQGDMVRVRPGMSVTVKNSAFPTLATGKVETVSGQIGTRSQLGDVMIRLDKNEPAEHLVGMEVEIVIGP